VLVFTSTQASELRRYDDVQRREGRYQVIADLAPIRTDLPIAQGTLPGPQTFIEREIVRALVERKLIPARDPIPKWMEMLPGHLEACQAGVLRAIEDSAYLEVLRIEYDAATFRAAVESRHGQIEKKGRVGDISNAPVPPEKAVASLAEMEKQFAAIEERSRRGELPPIPEGARDFSQAMGRGFLGRARQIGPRATLLELLPIARLTKEEQLKLTPEEHAEGFIFELCVRKVAGELLEASDSVQEFLARSIEPRDCPGTWLQRRLELCVRRASPAPEPSDHFDAERLAYLPYVDLMLTDKRMAEYVRQIRSEKAAPPRIRGARPSSARTRCSESAGRGHHREHDGRPFPGMAEPGCR
jgi:hypothetical protein